LFISNLYAISLEQERLTKEVEKWQEEHGIHTAEDYQNVKDLHEKFMAEKEKGIIDIV